jgi:hypothetical protein
MGSKGAGLKELLLDVNQLTGDRTIVQLSLHAPPTFNSLL